MCLECRQSPLGGLGLFATKNIEPGDTLLEDSEYVLESYTIEDCPEWYWELMSHSTSNEKLEIARGIFTTNGVVYDGSTYVYKMFSRFNHSCKPNAINFPTSDKCMIVVAGKPIQKDDEILISYLAPSNHTVLCPGAHRAYLQSSFHFDCGCVPCEALESIFKEWDDLMSLPYNEISNAYDKVCLLQEDFPLLASRIIGSIILACIQQLDSYSRLPKAREKIKDKILLYKLHFDELTRVYFMNYPTSQPMRVCEELGKSIKTAIKLS